MKKKYLEELLKQLKSEKETQYYREGLMIKKLISIVTDNPIDRVEVALRNQVALTSQNGNIRFRWRNVVDDKTIDTNTKHFLDKLLKVFTKEEIVELEDVSNLDILSKIPKESIEFKIIYRLFGPNKIKEIKTPIKIEAFDHQSYIYYIEAWILKLKEDKSITNELAETLSVG